MRRCWATPAPARRPSPTSWPSAWRASCWDWSRSTWRAWGTSGGSASPARCCRCACSCATSPPSSRGHAAGRRQPAVESRGGAAGRQPGWLRAAAQAAPAGAGRPAHPGRAGRGAGGRAPPRAGQAGRAGLQAPVPQGAHPAHQPHLRLSAPAVAAAGLRRGGAGALRAGADRRLRGPLVRPHGPGAPQPDVDRGPGAGAAAQGGHPPQRPPARPGAPAAAADAHGVAARLARREPARRPRAALRRERGAAHGHLGAPQDRAGRRRRIPCCRRRARPSGCAVPRAR